MKRNDLRTAEAEWRLTRAKVTPRVAPKPPGAQPSWIRAAVTQALAAFGVLCIFAALVKEAVS